MAYDYSLSPELNAARSSTSTEPQWVRDLRAQTLHRQQLELQNPEGVRARTESVDATKRRESEYLFALATGSTGAQLGTEGPRNSQQSYLSPLQTAQLLGLRAGGDAAQVLTGGTAGFTIPEEARGILRSPLLWAGVGVAIAAVVLLKRRAA